MNENIKDTIFNKDNYTINISLKLDNIFLIVTDSKTKEEYKKLISQEYFSNKNSFFSYFTIIGIKDFLINAITDSSKYNITKD